MKDPTQTEWYFAEELLHLGNPSIDDEAEWDYGDYQTGRQISQDNPVLWKQICISENQNPKDPHRLQEQYYLQPQPRYFFDSDGVRVYCNARGTQMIISNEYFPYDLVRIAMVHRNDRGRFISDKEAGALNWSHGRILYQTSKSL